MTALPLRLVRSDLLSDKERAEVDALCAQERERERAGKSLPLRLPIVWSELLQDRVYAARDLEADCFVGLVFIDGPLDEVVPEWWRAEEVKGQPTRGHRYGERIVHALISRMRDLNVTGTGKIPNRACGTKELVAHNQRLIEAVTAAFPRKLRIPENAASLFAPIAPDGLPLDGHLLSDVAPVVKSQAEEKQE